MRFSLKQHITNTIQKQDSANASSSYSADGNLKSQQQVEQPHLEMRPRQTATAEASQRQEENKAEAKKRWMEELIRLKQEVSVLREVAHQSEMDNSTQRETQLTTNIQATTQGPEDG